MLRCVLASSVAMAWILAPCLAQAQTWTRASTQTTNTATSSTANLSGLIVVPSTPGKWMDVADAINRQLSLHDDVGALPVRTTANLGQWQSPVDIVIAISPRSVALATQLVARQVWVGLVTAEYAEDYVSRHSDVSRFWVIDQPLHKHVALIRLILPKARNIGVLIDEHRSGTRLFDQLGSSKRPLLTPLLIEQSTDTISTLQHALPRIDAVLAVPDHTAVNQQTARGLLLATYARHVPVFAYSQSYVQAGALAGLYTDAEQMGEQVGTALRERMLSEEHHLDNFDSLDGTVQNKTPAIHYPQHYKVAVNNRVAQSLGIKILPKSKIIEALSHMQTLNNAIDTSIVQEKKESTRPGR